MRKIKLTSFPLSPTGKIKELVCYDHPVVDNQTLCANFLSSYDEIEITTEPITCPDCLAIIRECKELDLVPKPESKMTFKRVVGGDTPIRVFDKDVYIGLITINDSKEYVFNGYTKEVITEFRSAAITAKLRKLNGEKK